MGINVDLEDTIAAATLIAALIPLNPDVWRTKSYDKIAEACIDLGAEIGKARTIKYQDLPST
jgi:hypothetical protein